MLNNSKLLLTFKLLTPLESVQSNVILLPSTAIRHIRIGPRHPARDPKLFHDYRPVSYDVLRHAIVVQVSDAQLKELG